MLVLFVKLGKDDNMSWIPAEFQIKDICVGLMNEVILCVTYVDCVFWAYEGWTTKGAWHLKIFLNQAPESNNYSEIDNTWFYIHIFHIYVSENLLLFGLQSTLSAWQRIHHGASSGMPNASWTEKLCWMFDKKKKIKYVFTSHVLKKNICNFKQINTMNIKTRKEIYDHRV